MQVQRCPECGGRLKTNYCDICLRKVPFKGAPEKQSFQHIEGSSAHRQEKRHVCIDFGDTAKKKAFTTRKPRARDSKKKASVVAIVLAAMSVISALFGLVEDMTGAEPVPAPEPEPLAPVYTDVPAIEPTELYSTGEIIVTADYSALYYDEFALFMTVVNESESDIIVSTDLLSVNGYMQPGSFYAEVESGASVQESLQLYSWELQQAEIEEVAEISFYLNIYEAETYEDIAVSELITIRTDAADTYTQPPFTGGRELFRSEDLAVRLKSTTVYNGDCEFQLHIENLSDRMISLTIPKILVNDETADGYLWTTLRPGTNAIDSVYLYDVQILGIEEIEEVAMELHIEYMEDWYVDETVSEIITFDPNAP